MNLNKSTKVTIMISTDILILLFSIYLAYSLRWESYIYFPDSKIIVAFILGPIIGIPIFYFFGFYKVVVRFMGFESLSPILKATFIYSLLWTISVEIIDIYAFPRSMGIIAYLIITLLIFFSRIFAIWLITSSVSKPEMQTHKVAIYGAGSAGNKLLSLLSQNKEYKVSAFIDDDKSLTNRKLKGINIYSFKSIKSLIDSKNVTSIYIAIPSLSNARKKEIIKNLISFNIQIKILPSINDLISGDFVLKDLQELQIEDLLGRDEVVIDNKLLNDNTENKSILVTGAGGSVGSEICRQVIKLQPKAIILLENNEYSLYKIHQTLLDLCQKFTNKTNVIAVLGSVCDKELVTKTIKENNVQTLYHAAAYKHVPILESNIIAGIQNNIFGTINCANIAKNQCIENFILISTDKAVNPTSLMGATKRVSEAYIQSIAFKQNNKKKECTFNIVRFGNVLDSSGSVIPLFKKQIKSGGPITVTSKEITRYFMTIPEAAQLVIQAASLKGSGKIFVLNMGKPIKILDLAKKMADLSGFNVVERVTGYNQIEIKIIGLREGEKNFEELYYGKLKNTIHPKINEEVYNINNDIDFDEMISDLQKVITHGDSEEAKKIVFSKILEL
tara:strand:- start:200 stop:2047 length:1848 start_codon:yes stop_codon:yes gene_type:complete